MVPQREGMRELGLEESACQAKIEHKEILDREKGPWKITEV